MAWLLRDKRVPSIVIGASSVDHLLDNVKVADNMTLSTEELSKIDQILKG
jgi:L-glyceraldehyde 3-phosphate reductase